MTEKSGTPVPTFNVGDMFIASSKSWDSCEYYCKILEKLAGGHYRIHLRGINLDFDEEMEFSSSWIREYCTPLSKLHRVLA